VKFLQKKFPNLGKRGNKDDIEKELLKEFEAPLTSSRGLEMSVSGAFDSKDIDSKVIS